jgi:RNA polymerase-binding transcription factor DksA
MLREEYVSRAGAARTLPAGTGGPHWRAFLEDRWRARLQEVTELSLAYHDTAPAAPAALGGCGEDRAGTQETQRLFRRAVAARRKLADVEEALSRLTAGTFGYCEQCGSPIPAGLLQALPETPHCPRCAAAPAPAQRHAVARRWA